MENKNKQGKKVTKRNGFIAVDVWRSQFGTTSVKAIFGVFANTFKVEPHNMKNYTFSHCVNKLRALEDPNYIEPQDQSHAFVSNH